MATSALARVAGLAWKATDTGLGHHHQVVGAVAAGDDLFLLQAQFVGQSQCSGRLLASTMSPTTLLVNLPPEFQFVGGGEVG